MKTAIIGMGRMGRLRKECLKKQYFLELTAICDINSQHNHGGELNFYTDWRELMDTEQPEAVFVCTYNSAIPDIVCLALERGCHVFSEKPPGRNTVDAHRMADAAAAAPNCVLKFGFNHRLHNSVLEARALLDSGQFGKVVCARGVYGKAGAMDFDKQWRSDLEQAGGGILLDQGIHMLDLLLYFMGDLTLVKSIVANYVWQIPMEDNALALLQNVEGYPAMFHSSATQWRHIFRLELLCEEGYIHLEGLNTTTRSYGEETVRVGYKDLGQTTGKLGMPGEQVYYFDADNSWYLEVDEFVKAIRDGNPILHGTADDAVRLMRLIEEIYAK
ncbi:Gfo/Idh/MocA family oxidoreductase [Desulfovibrio sp. OttesenSCG-928-A18]|nr:Gfo/Idh/MocA family oxidoreductase [Desulfovibrio sp. OttesenSCG-928-A18]